MEEKEYKITVYSQNTVGVLNRITNIFTRRKINIESLKVAETHHKGISKFTIVAYSTPEVMSTVVKQMERIVEVLKANCSDSHQSIDQQLQGFIDLD